MKEYRLSELLAFAAQYYVKEIQYKGNGTFNYGRNSEVEQEISSNRDDFPEINKLTFPLEIVLLTIFLKQDRKRQLQKENEPVDFLIFTYRKNQTRYKIQYDREIIWNGTEVDFSFHKDQEDIKDIRRIDYSAQFQVGFYKVTRQCKVLLLSCAEELEQVKQQPQLIEADFPSVKSYYSGSFFSIKGKLHQALVISCGSVPGQIQNIKEDVCIHTKFKSNR